MDIKTYALANKKIKEVEEEIKSGGIESIEITDGYLIFTMKDGTEFKVAMPTPVVMGYYYESNFYKDAAHETLITPSTESLYVDITDPTKALVFRYNGTQYIGSNAAMSVVGEELRF